MTNSNETFKAGDEVYCPYLGFAIQLLQGGVNAEYPLVISGYLSLNEKGASSLSQSNIKAIFHATPENKALLESLYKCEFESPKLKGSDLTRKLLSEGKHVLCYVSGTSDIHAPCENIIRVIDSLHCYQFTNKGGSGWKYAVPCNDYANLPDGVLIKNEQ